MAKRGHVKRVIFACWPLPQNYYYPGQCHLFSFITGNHDFFPFAIYFKVAKSIS